MSKLNVTSKVSLVVLVLAAITNLVLKFAFPAEVALIPVKSVIWCIEIISIATYAYSVFKLKNGEKAEEEKKVSKSI